VHHDHSMHILATFQSQENLLHTALAELPQSGISHTIHRQNLGFSRVSRVKVRIRVSVRIRARFSFSGANL